MPPKMRPDRDTYALGIAQAVSIMGDCTRRQVGAVIIDRNKRIAGAGYNGSYPGGPSCLAGDCPRGRHYKRDDYAHYNCHTSLAEMHCTDPDCVGWGHPGVLRAGLCACGNDWPCPDAVPPGSSYDTGPGACHATHAEANAVADVDNRARLDGAILYVTHEPCEGCIRHIRNTTRIAAIRWPEGMVALP